MIFLAQIFHISNGTSYLAGIKRHNFDFEFPCSFNLYANGVFVRTLRIEGLILNNNYTVDEYFDKITVWMDGHLEKDLVNDKIDAYLKYIAE